MEDEPTKYLTVTDKGRAAYDDPNSTISELYKELLATVIYEGGEDPEGAKGGPVDISYLTDYLFTTQMDDEGMDMPAAGAGGAQGEAVYARSCQIIDAMVADGLLQWAAKAPSEH